MWRCGPIIASACSALSPSSFPFLMLKLDIEPAEKGPKQQSSG
jgi:hypothetical protein